VWFGIGVKTWKLMARCGGGGPELWSGKFEWALHPCIRELHYSVTISLSLSVACIVLYFIFPLCHDTPLRWWYFLFKPFWNVRSDCIGWRWDHLPLMFVIFCGWQEIIAISCSWCKAAYHNKVSCFMMQQIEEPCLLGVHADGIIPPSWIIKLPQKVLRSVCFLFCLL